MEEETIQIIIIIAALLGVSALGVIMLAASRWARRNNTEINQSSKLTQIEATEKSLREGRIPILSRVFWSGDLTNAQTIIGKVIAVLAIFFVSIFLLFAFYAVIKVI